VPKTAVRQDAGHDVVMVVRGGRAERRAVTVSGSTDNESALSVGLAPGERVIVDGPKDLPDGATVREANHE
jgi:multidrug efflux pump subunit AcrA (membrane-fusion protein)